MSVLGDDIRAKKVEADRLSTRLSQAATELRRAGNGVDWVSSSADRCRRTLGDLADVLDDGSRGATDFAADIWRHANTVEAHEAALTDALAALGDAFAGPYAHGAPRTPDGHLDVMGWGAR